jgi:hypothetical protein
VVVITTNIHWVEIMSAVSALARSGAGSGGSWRFICQVSAEYDLQNGDVIQVSDDVSNIEL